MSPAKLLDKRSALLSVVEAVPQIADRDVSGTPSMAAIPPATGTREPPALAAPRPESASVDTGPGPPSPSGSAGAALPESAANELDQLRLDIAGTIKTYFPWLFWLTLLVAGSLIVMIAAGFALDRTMATTVLAASVQVAFGMVIGFVCVYIGLMMTWFGIDAAYTVQASLGGAGARAEGALKSASPGLLFALGGIALIAVSLYKPIVYETQGLDLSSVRTSGGSGRSLPEPDPPRLPGQSSPAVPSPGGPGEAPHTGPAGPAGPAGSAGPASPPRPRNE